MDMTQIMNEMVTQAGSDMLSSAGSNIVSSMGSSIFSAIFGPIAAIAGELTFIYIFLSIISFLVGLAILATWYCFGAFQLLYTGRKAGIKTGTWMPFVPFARTIYRLKILDEQWWKMFVLEDCWVYISLISFIMLKISLKSIVFVVIFIVAYLILALIYNIQFTRKFFIAFGIKPMLVLAFTPFYFAYVGIVNMLIGYTDVFRFRGIDGKVISEIVVDEIKQSPHPAKQVRPSASVPTVGGLGSIRGVTGMYTGQVFNLAGAEEIIVGRDSSVSNIVLTNNASKISRRHCGIIFDSSTQRYSVIDYSSNGTFLENNTRLVAGTPTPLSRGTVIYLGNRDNCFVLE